MLFDVSFEESSQTFTASFGEVHNVSDGGYERGYADGKEEGTKQGYADGYSDGETAGYERGHAAGVEEGLASRSYETWTITLVDGTVVEKDVALL